VVERSGDGWWDEGLEKNTGLLEELILLDKAADVGGRREEQLATGRAVCSRPRYPRKLQRKEWME